ncbi:hypothetical protein VCRA2117O40_30005 [Vibrio crassostreae]|nr:hypothetical protein VCRA2117O40_30005 [Vibrio crassostreae]CAK3598270.1 hypothetical protein VCRA2120O58_30004 [Vibrio crassostreae]
MTTHMIILSLNKDVYYENTHPAHPHYRDWRCCLDTSYHSTCSGCRYLRVR